MRSTARIRLAGLAGAASGVLALATASPASAVTATECSGTLTGTYAAVVVPDGATCTLDGATVKGNVTLGVGATLMADGATVRLNVKGVDAKTVQLIDTAVWGQIHLRRTTGPIIIGTAGCKVDPIADGNINLQNNFGPIAICMMTVKNNIILHNNHKTIGVFGNTVGNNIQVVGNNNKAIRLRVNTVGGNLLMKGNLVSVAFQVKDNSMGGSAQCTGNDLAPTGSGNTAGGSLSGQCAGLG